MVAKDGEPAFGTLGERLAFFDAPVNERDPWHGFPVGGKHGMEFRGYPPDDVVEDWHKLALISFTTFTRIVTRRQK
jgi:hypothetical protein